MHWSWLIALACLCPAFAAYYNQLDVTAFEVEGLASNANFGFSVSSVFQNVNSKLIVGAPLSDLIGSVYLCDLNKETSTPCNIVHVAKNTFPQVKDERYKNHSCWLGGSVRGTDDFFVACAPLYIEEKPMFEDPPPGTYGRCYEYNPTRSELEQMKELSQPKRIKGPNNKDYKTPEETMDTFGWGLDIDSEKSVIVGSAAMSSGRAMKYVGVLNNNRKVYHYTQGKNNNVSINFGYSAASGIFSSSKSIMHAIGSTYGNDGHGTISLLNDKFKKSGYLTSEKVGTMFGAVLCTAKLSNDSKQSDLLVGAPTYATDDDAYNKGAVYIYQSISISNYKANVLMQMTRKVEGYESSSMFGSAIANVGDLNGDDIDDIVIAAPYAKATEGGTGIVYLFSGANLVDLSAEVKPIQTIEPVSPTHKLFGFSLTAIKDYDNNGYNELAVGVPYNNLVLVYRCAAPLVIKLKKLPAQVPNDGSGATQTLKVCFEVEYPKNLQEINTEIKVQLIIDHHYAKLKGSGVFTVTDFRTKEPSYCGDIDLLMPKVGSYNVPIDYTILATQVSDPVKRTSNVALSDLSVLKISGSIVASECKDVCVPSVKLHHPKFFKENSYKVGSSDKLDVMISVANEGQVAYDACMLVTITGVPLMKQPEGCSHTGHALECLPKQLLRKNHWNTMISLNMGALTSEVKKVTMKVGVFNNCGDEHPADESKEELILHNDYDGVNVASVTDDGVSDVVNLTRQHIADGKAFQHVYTISNKGITNWVDVRMLVTTQNLPFIKSSVLLTSGQQSCELKSSTESIETYSCLASELPRGAGIIAKVIMTIVPDELDDRICKEHLTVHSDLTVYLGDRNITANVTSELRLLEVKVEIWIYVVAAGFALVILVIFFFILRECGFLTRKNKVQLNEVRRSVRRQTILRQSMMPRPRSEDLDRLVEENQPPIEDHKGKIQKDRRLVVDES